MFAIAMLSRFIMPDSASLVAPRRLLLLGRTFAWQTGQWQIGYDARARLAAGIDDRLVGATEHPLHGLEIDPLPRHVGRLLILLIDLAEARGLALGFGDGLFAIGLGVLEDLGGAAARFRHDAIGIGLRFVLRALQIGARPLHVAEGFDHLRRRIDLLKLHLLHQDAGAVIVERLLHAFLYRGLDGLPRAGENGLNIGTPDHFAHRAFGDRLHRAFGLQYVEEEIADTVRPDLPQHREIDVDDVLVDGEHQGFFRHVTHGAASARIEADVDLVDPQRLRRKRGLDWIGQMLI